MAGERLLELKGISKSFGRFTANDNIDFELDAGEVHAVLGENGAGKSTLMNIIYGMYSPDAGEIRVRGKAVAIHSSKDALACGIGMVHQHFMMIDCFTAVENIYLVGRERAASWQDKKSVERKLEALKEKYGISVDLNSPVEQLSISMQQKVEILKLLYTGADILIFDEPTAVLLPQECDALFQIIANMAAEGKGVIFISHKLDEVLSISSRITVLSKGRVAGRLAAGEADKEKIIRMMVGEDAAFPEMGAKQRPAREELFRCEDIVAFDDRKVRTVNGVSLAIQKGEIVGIASVEGNGQTELVEVLAGVRKAAGGRVCIGGRQLGNGRSREFIRHRIGYVPADRNSVGAVPDFALYDNWILRSDSPPRRHRFLDYEAIKAQTQQAIARYDIRVTGVNDRSGNLSGGNLQKLILSRELGKNPRVLICEYPTRGLDIKATWFIRQAIVRAKNEGIGVLLLSGDFEELFALADRLIVLYRGKIVSELVPEQTNIQEVGRMMMGVTSHAPA